MSDKKDKKGTKKMKKASSEPIRVKVIYGNGTLTDCMQSVMRIHMGK